MEPTQTIELLNNFSTDLVHLLSKYNLEGFVGVVVTDDRNPVVMHTHRRSYIGHFYTDIRGALNEMISKMGEDPTVYLGEVSVNVAKTDGEMPH